MGTEAESLCCRDTNDIPDNYFEEKSGKLAMYESMKKSVIRVFDDGLVSATNTP